MDKNKIINISSFDKELTPKGHTGYYWLEVITDTFFTPVHIPVMVARGVEEGPTLGLTAAVHGNELNGISVIHRLFSEINPSELKGTIVGIPVVNVPSFNRKKRRFIDGVDLNHIMPGKKDGNVSQVYAFRIFEKIIKKFDYLLDLHTASSGRVNSYYIRADMSQPKVRELAMLQNADIIVNNPPSDGTLRGAAEEHGIHAITLEVGNPNTFQRRMIRSGVEGVHNVLCHLGMIEDEVIPPQKKTILCDSSYWIYTNEGGLLSVKVDLLNHLEEGMQIASLKNIFGKEIKSYYAPENGIVIGKSISPVNQVGGRILHLGIFKN